MKKLIIILILLPLVSYSQFIGASKEEVINHIQSDPDYWKIEYHYNNPSYDCYVTYESKSLDFVISACFFNSANECVKRAISYTYSSLNSVIISLNNSFVKVDDTTWINYQKQNIQYKLTKQDVGFSIYITAVE
ncbi:MAG: hypothetical protein K0S44_1149 [Bacteroidetes bacterium]|jgi:hypothetical protein|nr:hypothetical protein [Bacteroidota bacterium]